jgi:hypothetical protein
MQFKVPQFLDIEDKIFGPFTFREFVYLAGGAGLCFVLYKALGLVYGAIPILIIGGLSLSLTYYKPNNKPFIFMIESFVKYMFQSKLYIWERRKSDGKDNKIKDRVVAEIQNNGQRLNSSKLRDLAWSLDVLDLRKDRDTIK